MKQLKATIAFVLAAVAAGAAHAGAGIINTTVVPITTDPVTYSTTATSKRAALTSYLGYLVNVGSDPSNTNTINNVVFTATTVVSDGTGVAEFASSDGASCQQTANPTGAPANAYTIACAIGQLRAGEQYPTFVVLFKAPVKVVDTSVVVQFSGITYYAEGTGGLTSPPQNSTKTWSAANVPLGTSNPLLIHSVVPKTGGTLFTGDGGVSDSISPFTTTATIPAAATYTNAQIEVTPLPITVEPNCANFTPCYGTSLTIPGTFSPYLQFTFRVDSSQIKKGTNINGVVLYYQPSTTTSFTQIGDCASPTTPIGGDSAGTPCIAARKYYKNKGTPGWTVDLDGDFEWTILNLKNGIYKIN
jgi:hypothetical protein